MSAMPHALYSRLAIDHEHAPRAEQGAWTSIGIVNHHQPLSTDMTLLLGQGLRLAILTNGALGGPPEQAERYSGVRSRFVMLWGRA